MSRLIERNDFFIIRELAKKYNMNVADFGRSIVRQAERNAGRTVRLTESEYKYIKRTAKENDMTATRFCALACHAFLNVNNRSMPIDHRTDKEERRTKRLEVKLHNNADEIELTKIATEYSMKISSLIRYCSVRFNGTDIIL